MRSGLGLIAVLLACTPATATVRWDPSDAPPPVQGTRVPELSVVERSREERLEQFTDAAWFIAGLQVLDSGDPEYGGIREGEGDDLGAIIQTDNTSESIWVFSRYWQLTGDDAILPYLDRSWIYVNAHPAYDEEGPSTARQGYYRVYNCGWAVAAGLEYETVFGDLGHVAYVDSCANYLASHTLNVIGNGGFYDRVNPPVLGFAGGSLRAYGDAKQDSLWLAKAESRGDRVKGWIEDDPTILGVEVWAMSGGATMWGVLEAYFPFHPEDEAAWVAVYSPWMDTFANPGAWENAWQGWYAHAANRLETSTGDPAWGDVHVGLTDYLLAFDTDGDGGIPAAPSDPDSLDQAWVTAYLARFGIGPLLGDPGAVAAPVPATVASGSGPRLLPPRPNPFRAGGEVAFATSVPGRLRLEVLDVRGRRVALLLDERRPAGRHGLAWDGRGASGRLVTAGVYFLRLSSPGGAASRKLVLLR